MAVNIGPKIGVDGEAEYRAQIRRIIQEAQTLASEMRAVAAGFDKSTSAQEKARKTGEVLTKQVETQRERVKLLTEMWEKSAKELGENDVRTLRWKQVVNDANAELSRLEGELRATQEEMQGFGDEADNAGESLEEAGKSALSFGDILSANMIATAAMDFIKDFGREIADFAKETIEAAADVAAANAQFEQTFGDLESAASKSLDKISKDTGIAATRMKSSYTSIYAFAKTTGAESEEALDIASRALAAAADSAAYYDRSIEEVTESLQSFLKGNYANDAALGIAATETTRNAKANELYAKSFNELSESQKVDVLLAMVEAGNKASGALGQAAREADAWANVTGELAEAWKQFQAVIGAPILEAVTPLIQDITNALNDLMAVSAPKQLARDMDDFAAAMEAANAQFEAASTASEAAAREAKYYADRLDKLEKQGLDTADAQEEYAIIVDKLNDLVPDLNLEIDEHTGLVNRDKDAIYGQIEAMRQQAVMAALQDRLTEYIRAQLDADIALETAKGRLLELEQQETELSRQLAAAKAAEAEKTAEASDAANSAVVAFAALNGQITVAIDPVYNYSGALNETGTEAGRLEAQLAANRIEQAKLNEEIGQGGEKVSEYGSKVEEAEAYLKSWAEEMGIAIKAQDGQTESITEAEKAVMAVTEAYKNAKEEATDAINAQIGLFEELKLESDRTAQDIIANWRSQSSAFTDYSANLKKAVDMGLDEALVQQLSDGSAESMEILAALVGDTGANIDEINAEFQEMYKARETAAGAMAEVSDSVTEALEGLPDELKAFGIHAGKGLALGLRSTVPEVRAAAGALATASQVGYSKPMQINSPSRVMRKDGRWTGKGVVLGIEDMVNDCERAMQDLALSGAEAFRAIGGYDTVYLDTIQAPAAAPGVQNSYAFGDMSISIYQQPGEDADALARRVMDTIQREISMKEAALSG